MNYSFFLTIKGFILATLDEGLLKVPIPLLDYEGIIRSNGSGGKGERREISLFFQKNVPEGNPPGILFVNKRRLFCLRPTLSRLNGIKSA